ncbi:TetR/AcrR family transcriptional regulator [Pseudoduganella namucuonensis]|uniref:Transcriptional regulator, TetR family n=1 Tax=Pseudoduganella namucuonensis TaxID=1035707 RepID=A0A1I7GHK1_9BURK|nr:TetR/AcrR family transcriptional regulator [Pseudoduganella namucuonensis]SFU47756.1 transcriptional regulator, TetR family [Pseudoduganella namucuonensis]
MDTTHPQRLTDRKRQAIVEAALAEFRAHGFDATSMDKIAAAAGVSKRTVYNHFPSKDDLFAHILNELWASSAALQAFRYHPGVSLRTQLMDLMGQKMALLRDNYFLDLARVAIAEGIHRPERAREMIARLADKEEGVTAWIRAALEDGKLKPLDPAFASHLLQGQLKMFAFWPQVAMGQPPLDAAAETAVVTAAVEMFLAYYAV